MAVQKLDGDTKSNEQGKSGWSPEAIENLIKFVDELAGKYITYFQQKAQSENQYMEAAAKHNRHLVYTLSAFLGIVVVLMSYLAIIKVVSGDALLFLVGTITGYILLFIQRLTFGVQPNKPEASEGA
jgi:uncharacterized membrane protein YkgB